MNLKSYFYCYGLLLFLEALSILLLVLKLKGKYKFYLLPVHKSNPIEYCGKRTLAVRFVRREGNSELACG